MGYWFSTTGPADGGHDGPGLNLTAYEMGYVRLVMVEAGAIAGDGLAAALRLPGLEPCGETLAAGRFMSNDGRHVTAREAAFVAARLRRAAAHDVVGELAPFLDDCPDRTAWRGWVDAFAAFNEQAAARDGYHVS